MQQAASERFAGQGGDRGEVPSKALAPVGESTFLDVRAKWLRKSAEFDQDLESKSRERVLQARAEESRRNSRALSFDVIEEHLRTSQAFPKPVPLPVLVSVVNEIWDEEGL